MRIVYLGSGQFGLNCLDTLHKSIHELVFIATQPSRPCGRGKVLQATAAAEWAKRNSVEFMETGNINSNESVEKISSFSPDIIIVAAFGQKIGNRLIGLAPKGMINVHGSIVPKYRGAAPINWAIINGEKTTGISIITVVEQMDAGDVLATSETEIGADETAGELHDRLAEIARPILLKAVDSIADGSVEYKAQDHSKVTLAPKLKKSDGFLDFSESAEIIERKIRGFWPWPTCSAGYLNKHTGKGIRVAISLAKVVQRENEKALPAGTVDEELNVICGKDALRIMKIKPSGSELMDFAAFVNGRKTSTGDMFVRIDS